MAALSDGCFWMTETGLKLNIYESLAPNSYSKNRNTQKHCLGASSPVGDFNVGVNTGVYCTFCTVNTDTNTNFEITHCMVFA
jgi:hypothetical protein